MILLHYKQNKILLFNAFNNFIKYNLFQVEILYVE